MKCVNCGRLSTKRLCADCEEEARLLDRKVDIEEDEEIWLEKKSNRLTIEQLPHGKGSK